jgi:hypothetical protein
VGKERLGEDGIEGRKECLVISSRQKSMLDAQGLQGGGRQDWGLIMIIGYVAEFRMLLC